MQFEIDPGEIREMVTFTVKYSPMRPTAPVLGGVLIRADMDGTVASSVFDYEISGQACGQAAVTAAGQAIVSSRKLAEIVTMLKGGKGGKHVTLTTDDTRLTVRHGATVYTLPLMPLSEYPALPELPPLAGLIGSDLLAVITGQVASAVSTDDTLPALTGVRLEIRGSQLTVAATDRYRLAVRDVQWQPEHPDADLAVIIPGKVMVAATAALTTAAETSIWLDTSGDPEHPAAVIGFSAGGKQVTSRLISAEYPRYRALIPASHEATAQVPLPALADAVKRVAIAAEPNTAVRLCFNGDRTITLTAGTGGDITSADQVDEVEFDGEAGFTVAYNPGYLGDALATVAPDSPDTCVIEFTTAKKPAVLSGKDTGPQAYKHILMPINL